MELEMRNAASATLEDQGRVELSKACAARLGVVSSRVTVTVSLTIEFSSRSGSTKQVRRSCIRIPSPRPHQHQILTRCHVFSGLQTFSYVAWPLWHWGSSLYDIVPSRR